MSKFIEQKNSHLNHLACKRVRLLIIYTVHECQSTTQPNQIVPASGIVMAKLYTMLTFQSGDFWIKWRFAFFKLTNLHIFLVSFTDHIGISSMFTEENCSMMLKNKLSMAIAKHLAVANVQTIISLFDIYMQIVVCNSLGALDFSILLGVWIIF